MPVREPVEGQGQLVALQHTRPVLTYIDSIAGSSKTSTTAGGLALGGFRNI
jgi:hypothetical protein